MKYRPWGPIEWALSLSSPKPWHFIGVVGTEERSLCSWSHMKGFGVINSELFLEIQDVDSEKYRERIRAVMEARRVQFNALGGNLAALEKMELMAELFLINAFARKAESVATSVVLDITSFPKRYFFPILRALTASSNVKNLIVTYTSPMGYAPDDEPLCEDIEKKWRALPGFGGSSVREQLWVVSVGFMVESLREHVGDNPDKKMKLLIPFPAPLSALRRTWESVANLERGQPVERFDKFRVETLDMSAAFDRIRQLAGNPEKALAFAPFGPKPTSAAMCLYAMQRDSSVHYPQPTVYHPDYSRGIRNNDPATAVSAYWIKHEGENLYMV